MEIHSDQEKAEKEEVEKLEKEAEGARMAIAEDAEYHPEEDDPTWQ